jgi:DNA-binding CsgD family transcriptional regulator
MNLIGRAEEISFIDGVLAERPDSPAAVTLLGDPGVGKSALLDYATQTARQTNRLVVTVRGVEQETEYAYFGLHQAITPLETFVSELNSLQAEALRTISGEGNASAPPDRLTVNSTLFNLLVAASRSRPVVLVVDDIQWLDTVSREALLFAARRIEGSPIRFLGASRRSPDRGREVWGIPAYDIAPLNADSADLLLRQRFPSLAPLTRTRLLADAEGNPLALLELPAVLTDRSRVERNAIALPLALTRRLQETFSERIDLLPGDTRELLLVAALEGSGELNILRRALGDPSLSALAAAEDAGVVRVAARGDRLIFRHPLTRAAVVDAAGSAARRLAHSRLALALDFDMDRKARHLAEATLQPNEEIAQLLHAAAKRAAQKGLAGEDTAVGLLIRSADLSPDMQDRRRRMAEAAFMAAFHGASSGDPTSSLDTSADFLPGSDEALWAASASAFLGTLRMSDLKALFRLVESALEAASTSGNVSSEAFATTVQTFSYLCTLADDSAQSNRLDHWTSLIPKGRQSDGVNLLRAHIDPARMGLQLLAQVKDAINQADNSPDPLVVGQAAAAGAFLDLLGASRPALQRIANSEVDWQHSGDIPIRTLLTTDAFHAGRWTESLQIARDGLLISETRDTALFTAYFQHQEALIAAVTGDSHRAITIADPLMSTFADRGYGRYKHEVMYGLLFDALGRGDFESAFETASAISPPGELRPGVGPALWVFHDLIVAAVFTGRSREARRHLAEVRRLKVSAISPHYSLLVASSEAVLSDGGEKSAAILAPHLESPELMGWPFDLARVRLMQAEYFLSAGRTADALTQVDKVIPALESLRARPWLSIARRLQDRSAATALTINTFGLTSTEMKVVRLAASGLTNKQIAQTLFVSDRTVGTHLYRAFPKLGISRRVSLRDAVEAIDAGHPLTFRNASSDR